MTFPRTTHTFSLIPVSHETYAEISAKLKEAGYDHAFDSDGTVDLHGLALEKPEPLPEPEPLYVLISRAEPVFWRPDSAGYTSDLLEAGLYTEAESAVRIGPSYGGMHTRQLATDAIAQLAERKRRGLARVEPRMLELFERAMGRAREHVEELRHLARVPFVATCGADERDLKTTDDPSRTNCLACLRLEAAAAEKLAGFKRYVHERLDQMNVPHDPSPAGTAKHGCRVEGRFDWVIDQMVALEDKIEALETDAPPVAARCSKCGLDPEIRNLDCAECSK